MKKRMLIMLLAVGLVLGLVVGWKAFGSFMMKKYMAGMASRPETVSTIKAEMLDWQPEIRAVGTLKAAKGADIASEVAGVVEEIRFESGQDVEADTLLVRLANADDVAKLAALESAAKLAEITLHRDEKQFEAQAVSRATVDADIATLTSAKALTAQQLAIVNKKVIRAPFAGRAGVRAVDVGQYVSPGATIVTLQQLDPIYLDFYLPQQTLSRLQMGQKITLKTDAFPEKSFEGEISAINAKVDESTRNILVRASFKNPDKLLLPGMYATAEIATGSLERKLTLPQTAITYNPYGNTVYVVETKQGEEEKEPALIVKQTFVTTGETRGDQVAILSGLEEGAEVVTAGQLKLRNGSLIKINNTIQPLNDPNPKPEEK